MIPPKDLPTLKRFLSIRLFFLVPSDIPRAARYALMALRLYWPGPVNILHLSPPRQLSSLSIWLMMINIGLYIHTNNTFFYFYLLRSVAHFLSVRTETKDDAANFEAQLLSLVMPDGKYRLCSSPFEIVIGSISGVPYPPSSMYIYKFNGFLRLRFFFRSISGKLVCKQRVC